MKSERINLAPDLSISRVVTGLWQIADMERDGKSLDLEATAQAMAKYADAGLTTFDMADHYGSAEVVAGLFKKKYAGRDVQLFTKWVPVPGPVTKQIVRTAVERSLERLQSERIDLMQFHAWNYADPRWLDCLYYLQELRQEGLIAHLGLTNFDSAHLLITIQSGIQVISNQISYSLLDRRAANSMGSLCQQHNIKILAFGTLAGGFLSEKWLNKPEPSIDTLATWSEMKYKRFIDAAGGWNRFQKLLSILHSVARKNKVSMANVASKVILDQPNVAAVIVGARLGMSEHVIENSRLFEFTLEENDRKVIQDIQSMLDPIPGDCGDEYRKPPFLTASGDLSHHVEGMPLPFPSQTGSDGRTKALSGTVWEDIAGFSRAVRKGNTILVSGTTATHGTMDIGGSDPAAQTHFIIDKIEGAIQSLGGKLDQVVRTRLYIKNISDWEPIARAHGERFKDIQPANTMIRADLIGENYLVEMEAEAIVD